MRKHSLAAIAACISLLLTACGQTSEISDVSSESEFAPAVSECTGVKLTAYYEAHPDKTMTVQEQLDLFESYCKSYLGEFEREYACFDTAERDLLDGHYEIDGIEDTVFVAYPKLDDYMDKILDGSVVPAWYLYVDHQRQIYLWWSAQSMMYPHWFNKGETLRSLDEYYKASSAIPTDIGEPVAV